MTLRIGIGLFTGQLPRGTDRTFAQEYRDTLELVRLAEAMGFDSAWVSEHHGASDGYLPSLLPMLAAFAAATDRIRLGTGVVLTPFHDPIRLAEDAAVVDQISEGRLTLGLGIAWRPEEFRMFRVPITERLPRTIETVEILRRAWTGERFSFDGEVFALDRVRVTPPPAQPGGPPILLGRYAEAAVGRAGRIADGHITDADDVEAVRTAVRLMEDGARGRPRPDVAHTRDHAEHIRGGRGNPRVGAGARGCAPPVGCVHGVGRGRRHAGGRHLGAPRRHGGGDAREHAGGNTGGNRARTPAQGRGPHGGTDAGPDRAAALPRYWTSTPPRARSSCSASACSPL